MKISLLVIRCQDIAASKAFYEMLGLSFVKEKHGNGPAHYACEHDGFVFELYPNKGEPPRDNNRLGLEVSNLTEIIKQLSITDSYECSGSTVYITIDPDGRKIELRNIMSTKKETQALAAIRTSLGTAAGEECIELFIDHHLEELDPSEWIKSLGIEAPTKEQVLRSLILKSSWDDDCIYDFTLPNDVTDYVVSVKFSEKGEVEAISMES